eukprot:9502970-Pyramimonas_sp.AAC.2
MKPFWELLEPRCAFLGVHWGRLGPARWSSGAALKPCWLSKMTWSDAPLTLISYLPALMKRTWVDQPADQQPRSSHPSR